MLAVLTSKGKQTILIVAIIAAVMISIIFYSAYVINNPAAHWKFDGDLTDSGKYRYETIGGAKFVEGKHGQALSLNDENAVVIKDNPTIRLQGPFTLSLWAKNDDLSGFAGLLGRSYGQSDTGGYTIYNNKGDLRFKRDSQNIPIAAFNDTTKYHLITLTYDGETIRGYFDGMLTMSERMKLTTNVAHFDLILGIPPGTAVFKGSIDDLRIYDRALSPLDILIMVWS